MNISLGSSEPKLFVELLRLKSYSDGVQEYVESHRWIRFEEHVEDSGGLMWSPPHISTPSLMHWLNLHDLTRSKSDAEEVNYNLTVMLDMEDVGDLMQLYHNVCIQLVKQKIISLDQGKQLKHFWVTTKLRHHFEGSRRTRRYSIPTNKILLNRNRKVSGEIVHTVADRSGNEELKNIPENLEAAVILEGLPQSIIRKSLLVIVRLSQAHIFAAIPEVEIPTKFLLIVSPFKVDALDNDDRTKSHYFNSSLGYALGASLTNPALVEKFHNATSRQDIANIFSAHTRELKYLSTSGDVEELILPPSNPDMIIQKPFRNYRTGFKHYDVVDELSLPALQDAGLVRTKTFFGGLINDIKRKKTHYFSDFFTFHSQYLSSMLFIYFASLAPIIAFGGLMGKATGDRIAIIESLVRLYIRSKC